jgi:hypothetical protein
MPAYGDRRGRVFIGVDETRSSTHQHIPHRIGTAHRESVQRVRRVQQEAREQTSVTSPV